MRFATAASRAGAPDRLQERPVAIPARRHSPAMLSAPRGPSGTMRVFSRAERCLRVLRRMSLTTFPAGGFVVSVFRPVVRPPRAR